MHSMGAEFQFAVDRMIGIWEVIGVWMYFIVPSLPSALHGPFHAAKLNHCDL
jgi:hypothetical protein